MLKRKMFMFLLNAVLISFMAFVTLIGCNPKQKPTLGSLEIRVSPNNATVTIVGSNKQSKSFIGSKTINNLTPGNYSIAVKLKDYEPDNSIAVVKAGVTTKIVIVLQKKQNHKPVIHSFEASPNPVIQNAELKFKWHISDSDNENLSCTILPYKNLVNKDVIQIKDCAPQGSYIFTYPEVGNYDAEIWVFDKANSTSKSTISVQVTKDLQKPLLIKSFTATPNRGRAPLEVLFEWETDDEDISSVSCKLFFQILGTNQTIRRDNCGGKQNRGKRFKYKGNYIVKLEVTNSRGQSKKQEMTIVVDEALNPGVLQVRPNEGFVSKGKQGNRDFLPAEKCYVVKNIGGADIKWEATENADWLRVHDDDGFLDPNEEERICFQIRQRDTDDLDVGSYTEIVKFVNVINHKGDTNRPATIVVE